MHAEQSLSVSAKGCLFVTPGVSTLDVAFADRSVFADGAAKLLTSVAPSACINTKFWP